MKIAILGATHGIGLALAQAALDEGHEVRGLARRPERMPLQHERLQLHGGDAHELESVAKLVEGQDVVCDCLGTHNVLERTTLFSKSAENLAKVLDPEQLLIAITGVGAGDSRGHGGFLYDRVALPTFLRRIYADKERQEGIIRERIARWIIVRPGFLTNGPRTGRYRALTDLKGVRAGKISRADVADFMLAQAKDPSFLGQAPLLTY